MVVTLLCGEDGSPTEFIQELYFLVYISGLYGIFVIIDWWKDSYYNFSCLG